MRDHRRLKVFQLADRLALLVYERTRDFPSHERFGLSAQMRRAAVSTATNIVEGAARRSDADFSRFLIIAYGSAREVEYQASLANRLGYITPAATEEINAAASQTARALRALITRIAPSSGSQLVARCSPLSRPIPRRDRITPVSTERPVTDTHAGRCLPSLVLVALHHIEHAAHGGAVEAAGGNFVD